MHQWDKQLPSFRMRGLKPDEIYRCGEMEMTGRALMNLGVHISLKGDYDMERYRDIKKMIVPKVIY